jgi:hypothetical protein
VRPMFRLLIRACPARAEFYAALGPADSSGTADLESWLGALEGQVERLEAFYTKGKQ